MEARCMKCKKNRTMVNGKETKMKNKSGTIAMKGQCEVCGCGMFRMLPKKK